VHHPERGFELLHTRRLAVLPPRDVYLAVARVAKSRSELKNAARLLAPNSKETQHRVNLLYPVAFRIMPLRSAAHHGETKRKTNRHHN